MILDFPPASLRRTASLLALALLLPACTVGPNYRPPVASELKVPERFNGDAAQQSGTQVDLARWWTAFNDPVLTQLVERAQAGNLDVAQAGARLRAARASVREARGALLPSVDAGGSVSRSEGRPGGDDTGYDASIDAAWELDVFGGGRRSVEAARASAGGAQAELDFAQLSVASEVGLNYISARLAQQQLAIARENLSALDDTVQIVGWRVQAGLVSSLDLEQARQLRAQTAAGIPNLETSYAAAANRIAVLIGEAPGAVTALLNQPRPVPLPEAALSAGIPAEVLQRRPDVASAERTLAAETARIGVATAELYPALRLSGSIGSNTTSLDALPDNIIGNLIGSITAPIFQGGQIRARIEGQRANTDAALAAYRSTVLVALEDVENALVQLNAAGRRERELIVSEQAARNAVIYARSQYRAGLIDFQALLESERALLSAQDSRAAVRADRASATIQLYKALGGGWQNAPVPATALTSSTTRP